MLQVMTILTSHRDTAHQDHLVVHAVERSSCTNKRTTPLLQCYSNAFTSLTFQANGGRFAVSHVIWQD